jgi:hypothetical protein
MLSQSQIRHYREEGYVLVPDFFPKATIDGLRRVTDELTEAARAVAESNHVYDLDEGHGPDRVRLRRIKFPTKVHPAYKEALHGSLLLDTLAELLGPAIRQFGGKINMKLAGSTEAIEWHQDWSYYPHTNENVLAVGVMLDDCTTENGPLLVIPRSHRGPVIPHENDAGVFCGAIDPGAKELDASRAVALTGPAGSITIHQARLIHGSAPNRSGRHRRMMFIPYTAADAWPLVGMAWDSYCAEIVRGRPTKEPRMQALPVRLPYPQPPKMGSLFEIQESADRRFFAETKTRVA